MPDKNDRFTWQPGDLRKVEKTMRTPDHRARKMIAYLHSNPLVRDTQILQCSCGKWVEVSTDMLNNKSPYCDGRKVTYRDNR